MRLFDEGHGCLSRLAVRELIMQQYLRGRESCHPYMGVEKDNGGGWKAFYSHSKGAKFVLGGFQTEREAAEAHDMAVLVNQDRCSLLLVAYWGTAAGAVTNHLPAAAP